MHFSSTHKTATIVLGFTLIELVIYAGLVTILLGTFLSAVTWVTNTQNRDRERHAVIENERVIGLKLDNLLYGVSSSSMWIWPFSTTGGLLFFQQPNGNFYALYQSGDSLQLASAYDSNGDGIPDNYFLGRKWTNNHTTVSSVQFTRTTVNGQAVITMQVTLTNQFKTDTLTKTFFLQ